MLNQKFIEEYLTKRICETTWHEEIELKKFQRCPRCHSEAYHLVIILKTLKKEK